MTTWIPDVGLRIVVGLLLLAALFVAEALRARRAHQIEEIRAEIFRTCGVTSAEALVAALRESAEAIARLSALIAVSWTEAAAALASLGTAVSVSAPELESARAMPIDPERCWRFVEPDVACGAPVPREDELGLCERCKAELREAVV